MSSFMAAIESAGSSLCEIFAASSSRMRIEVRAAFLALSELNLTIARPYLSMGVCNLIWESDGVSDDEVAMRLRWGEGAMMATNNTGTTNLVLQNGTAVLKAAAAAEQRQSSGSSGGNGGSGNVAAKKKIYRCMSKQTHLWRGERRRVSDSTETEQHRTTQHNTAQHSTAQHEQHEQHKQHKQL